MFEQTEIDGVPTLLAPTAGPMRAGLAFRVGRADETQARAGVTHLIEHLALHGRGLTDYHFNGATAAVTTHFHMQGTEDDVVAFLDGVCASLADLPMDRLETEKSILRTEAAGRSRGVNEAMPVWRYGARGYGLLNSPEWGLPELTEEFVRGWAARWFTRENAVLWIAGDRVPPGLKLALPAGQRMPLPERTSALPTTPAFFGGDGDGVVLNAVVRRSCAASAYATVLERQLYRSLRQDNGLSYHAGTSYDSSADGTATITAVADALPEKSGAVLGGFIDVLMALKAGRVEESDVAAHRTQAAESLRHAEFAAALLPSAAGDLLAGRPRLDSDEWRREIAALTPADVHAVAEEVLGSALLMTPSGYTAEWAGFTEAPRFSGQAVMGRSHRAHSGKTSLVIGDQGVSIVSADDKASVITVRFDECVALLAWPDGARRLIGQDGFQLQVEPRLFDIPAQQPAAFDERVDRERIVRLPARAPEQIPARPEPLKPLDNLLTRHRTALVAIAVSVTVVGVVALLSSGALRPTPMLGTVLRFGLAAGVIGVIGVWYRRNYD